MPIILSLSVARAGDWPMWRYDVGRTGASPDELPEKLRLQWRRDLPPVVPAWPFERRLQFDVCYEPVIVGNSLFIGSPNDGSVTAYDTETGDQKWKFYTNGPVRFAPVVWKGKLYVASDDGRVYCLDSSSGSVRWTFRAAPGGRPDLHHLGNNRLVSFWPVRGGPVIANGTLYFGSGIWPTMGTFVYAVDPETGKEIWSNARLNYIANIRIDHNRVTDSALAPQGYLVAEAGKLLVPNGRSMPVGLDPETGKLLYYVQGYRRGECRVTARGKYVFVGKQAALDINTGREVGQRWHDGHKDTPKGWSRRYDLFEGPYHAYKFIPGCDAWSVLDPSTVYGSRHGTFYAYDIVKAKKSTYRKKVAELDLDPGKWDAPLRWKLRTQHAPKKWPSSALIRAGRRLFGHSGRMLMAVQLPGEGEQPKVSWEQELPGTPSSMAAANGKLFVVTREGGILCFGGGTGKPNVHALVKRPLPEINDEWQRQATDILEARSTVEGFCLVLGLKNGRLVEELLRQTKLRVMAVDADRKKIDALRDKLAAAGVYGSRSELFVADPLTFSFPPYIASLVVSEVYDGSQLSQKMTRERLIRMLRPYGGAACLDVPAARWESFKTWAGAARREKTSLSRTGRFGLLRREGALPDTAPWTHESSDAARSYFSHDRLVKPPLGVLWYGDGPDHGFKKNKDYHVGVKPQVVTGRLFAFNDLTRTLQAHDVYTGRSIWKRTAEAFTRFASMVDGIYVAGGNMCVVYDPATGEERKRFTYTAGDDKDRKLFVSDIRVGHDVIVIAVAFEKVRNIAKGLYDSAALIGLDRQSGQQLWTLNAKERFSHHALALGSKLVFCVDSPSNETTGELQRRGAAPKTVDSTVLAIHPRTGKVKWQKVISNPFTTYGDASWNVQSRDDALSYSEACDILIVYKDRRYRAMSGTSGTQVWERENGPSQPIIVRGEVYYDQGGGTWDVRTNKNIPTKASVRGGNGCNHAVANAHLFFRRTFTAAYFSIQTGKATYLRNLRSGCTNSLIPADGVLSAPCFSVGCICNHPVETSFSLVHMPITEGWEGSDPVREPLPLGERDPAKWK